MEANNGGDDAASKKKQLRNKDNNKNDHNKSADKIQSNLTTKREVVLLKGLPDRIPFLLASASASFSAISLSDLLMTSLIF